jgi:Zn-dependent protease with chaperone function
VIIAGAVALVIGLWLLQEQIGNLLGFLSGPMIRRIVEWFHPARSGPVLLILLAAVWMMDIVGQWTKASQLVARAVEVTPTTFPQLAPIVDELRSRFDLPRTRVFISRDAPATGYTIGVREPHAVVFSAGTVGSLTPDEFKFVLGREMGHIKLRHTLSATVLGSANMPLPAPFSSLLKIRGVLFGTYQHAQELSCDRIGVVATRDMRPALTALIKQNLGTVRGAKIDLQSMAPQRAELRQGVSGATLKMTQMLSSQPFTLTRLHELTAWAGEPVETPAAASPAPAAAEGVTPAAAASSVPAAVDSPAPATVQDVSPSPAAPSTTPAGAAASPATASESTAAPEKAAPESPTAGAVAEGTPRARETPAPAPDSSRTGA